MRLFAPNELHSDLTSPKGPKTQYKGWKKKDRRAANEEKRL